MRYFHTTDAAKAILRDGFRDGTGSYLFATLVLTGVFLADSPADVSDGATGDQVLAVDLDADLAEFEIVEDGRPPGAAREWCVPAALINTRATVTLLSESDVDALLVERWHGRGGR